jgi:hypothetical protein
MGENHTQQRCSAPKEALAGSNSPVRQYIQTATTGSSLSGLVSSPARCDRGSHLPLLFRSLTSIVDSAIGQRNDTTNQHTD